MQSANFVELAIKKGPQTLVTVPSFLMPTFIAAAGFGVLPSVAKRAMRLHLDLVRCPFAQVLVVLMEASSNDYIFLSRRRERSWNERFQIVKTAVSLLCYQLTD